MENLDQLFSFTAADALAETESKKKSFSGSKDLYKPSIKDEKCKDMNYRALVRFIPFIHENKMKTVIERWECFLSDVNGDNRVFVVSPKTIGKSCPMRNMSYKLYTSDNAIDKANSKKINVYQQWYALIEVVKDPQHPDYEGQYFIYQFGKKIYDKIQESMKGSEYQDAINPFDLYNAPLFELNLTKGAQKMDNGREVTNYDACRFIPRTAPLHFGEGQTLGADIDSKKAFMTWLDENAPKINEYQWKEWDAELTEKVNTNLATYQSGYVAPRSTTAKASESLESLQGVTVTASPKAAAAPAQATSVSDIIANNPVEDDPFGAPAASTSDDDAWVDSILG